MINCVLQCRAVLLLVLTVLLLVLLVLAVLLLVLAVLLSVLAREKSGTDGYCMYLERSLYFDSHQMSFFITSGSGSGLVFKVYTNVEA